MMNGGGGGGGWKRRWQEKGRGGGGMATRGGSMYWRWSWYCEGGRLKPAMAWARRAGLGSASAAGDSAFAAHAAWSKKLALQGGAFKGRESVNSQHNSTPDFVREVSNNKIKCAFSKSRQDKKSSLNFGILIKILYLK